MKQCEINISYLEKTHDELTDIERELLEKAVSVARNAYAPYSQFRVGAALLLENGEIFYGSNQENAAFPSSMCAERVTMFYANAQRPNMPIITLLITALDNDGEIRVRPVPPCGSCRQALLETEVRQKSKIRILLAGKDKVVEFASITDLLPFIFTGNDLI